MFGIFRCQTARSWWVICTRSCVCLADDIVVILSLGYLMTNWAELWYERSE